MKQLLPIFVALLIFVACKKKDRDPNCQPESSSYTFSIDKQVDTVRPAPNSFFAVVNPGSDIVFEYDYASEVCMNIADEGHFDKLVFEVPAGSTSFDYDQLNELETAKCYFTRSCFCNNVSAQLVTGSVKGIRINDGKWSVQVNVTDPARNISLSFNKTFLPD